MKLHSTFSVILLSLLFIGIIRCRKFVEIAPPNNKLVTTSVFSDAGAATAAILGIYSKMQDRSYSMAMNCGLLSDELKNNSNDVSLISYYKNSMNIASTPETLWDLAYNYVYQANATIEGLENSKDLPSRIRNQLLGEARFIRAYWYFYMTNCYGDVPLVTSTDYTINRQLPRARRDTIYQQIISDLLAAEPILNSNFVDQSDTSITVERVRPTKWAAAALLARTYLYTGDYANAELKATEIINNSSLFTLEPDLNRVFLANSSEAIWQMAIPTPTTINTIDGFSFILKGPPRNFGIGNTCTISTQLFNAFESGDQRKNNWIDSFTTTTVPIVTYNFPYKYKIYQSKDITEYTMMLRLAEQYLIRAEARAQQSNPTGAIADLNAIRLRAGLTAYGGSTAQAPLLSAILHERQIELFAEWGHRWFDLIRTGNANTVMNVITPFKGGSWDPNQQLFPIPQSERAINSHLSQNDGY